jgi:hypothetical protein
MEEFARRMRVTLGTAVEETTLDRFLAHHVERTDPYDTRAQALRPRYEALKTALRTALREWRRLGNSGKRRREKLMHSELA